MVWVGPVSYRVTSNLVESAAKNADFSEILAARHFRQPNQVFLSHRAHHSIWFHPQGQFEGSQLRQDAMKPHVLEHLNLAAIDKFMCQILICSFLLCAYYENDGKIKSENEVNNSNDI